MRLFCADSSARQNQVEGPPHPDKARKAHQHVGEPSLRIDVVELCGHDQAVETCSAMTAARLGNLVMRLARKCEKRLKIHPECVK